GVVDRRRAAFGASGFERRPGGFSNERFAFVSVSAPAAERGDGVLVFDRAPKRAGVLELPALGGHGSEKSDAEHAPGAVAYLLGEGERLPGAALRVVDAAGLQGEPRELGEHSALPPRDADFATHCCALLDQFRCALLLAGVPCDRAERADRLRDPEVPFQPVVVSFVDRLALLDKRPRALEVALPHREVAQTMKEHRPAVLVPELLEEGEPLLPQPLSRVIVAGDGEAAAVAAQTMGAHLGPDGFGTAVFEERREPANALARVVP